MNFSSPSRLGWCLRSNSITLSIAARLGSDHQLTCSKPAVHQYPLLAGTASSPPGQTAVLLLDRRFAQRQLSAGSANGQSRPSAVVHGRLLPGRSTSFPRSLKRRPSRCSARTRVCRPARCRVRQHAGRRRERPDRPERSCTPPDKRPGAPRCGGPVAHNPGFAPIRTAHSAHGHNPAWRWRLAPG